MTSALNENSTARTMGDEGKSNSAISTEEALSAPNGTATGPLMLSNFLRGGVAGCTAKVMIYPFDRLKMIYQVRGSEVGRFGFRSFARRIRHVVQREGVTSLWKGNLTALGKTFPHSAIVFFSFDTYYKGFANTFPESLPLARLLAGGFAGLTATAITYPIDVWNTRMAVSYGRFNYREVIMIPKENFRMSLSRGFLPTAIGIFPYAGISFLCFETLKSIIVINKRHRQQQFMERQRFALEFDTAAAAVEEQGCFTTGHLNLVKQTDFSQQSLSARKRTLDRVANEPKIWKEEKFDENESMNQSTNIVSATTSPRNSRSLDTKGQIDSARLLEPGSYIPCKSENCNMTKTMPGTSEFEHTPLSRRSTPATQSSREELSVLESMVCGGAAGVLSQSATYPLDTVRKVLQANFFLRHFQQGGYCSRLENPTMGQVFREIFQASGLRGFYNGLSLNWVKGFVAAAIAFTLNDKLKPF